MKLKRGILTKNPRNSFAAVAVSVWTQSSLVFPEVQPGTSGLTGAVLHHPEPGRLSQCSVQSGDCRASRLNKFCNVLDLTTFLEKKINSILPFATPENYIVCIYA